MPAFAVVGSADTLISTSSVLAVQLPLLIVQRNVAVPAVKPVTPDVAEDGVVIVAVPLTTLQLPVPTDGTFPANVAIVVLHRF